ncbi:uncharacterized protein DS421_18g614820 [Arachis hypogaea]|nr:uncharacterized protein DS421_18g614820 [Arachis hypogaea]
MMVAGNRLGRALAGHSNQQRRGSEVDQQAMVNSVVGIETMVEAELCGPAERHKGLTPHWRMNQREELRWLVSGSHGNNHLLESTRLQARVRNKENPNPNSTQVESESWTPLFMSRLPMFLISGLDKVDEITTVIVVTTVRGFLDADSGDLIHGGIDKIVDYMICEMEMATKQLMCLTMRGSLACKVPSRHQLLCLLPQEEGFETVTSPYTSRANQNCKYYYLGCHSVGETDGTSWLKSINISRPCDKATYDRICWMARMSTDLKFAPSSCKSWVGAVCVTRRHYAGILFRVLMNNVNEVPGLPLFFSCYSSVARGSAMLDERKA